MDDFGHRTGAALVLGASGGLGLVTARMLIERGSNVALTYFRSAGKLDPLLELAKAAGRTAAAWQLDLTDAAQTAEVIAQVAADSGGIHTLVYAAGPHIPMRHLSRITPEDFKSQMIDDAVGFFHAAHAALPICAPARAISSRSPPRPPPASRFGTGSRVHPRRRSRP